MMIQKSHNKLFYDFDIMSAILPYYGTFRNWKFVMKRLSIDSNQLWSTKSVQFKKLALGDKKSFKQLEIVNITMKVFQTLINHTKNQVNLKLSMTVVSVSDYEHMIKFLSKIQQDRLPIR